MKVMMVLQGKKPYVRVQYNNRLANLPMIIEIVDGNELCKNSFGQIFLTKDEAHQVYGFLKEIFQDDEN